MTGWSNTLTGCINYFTLLVGFGILTVGITFSVTHISTCHTLVVPSCLKLGTLVVLVSLLGLLGSCLRSSFLLWIYLVFYFVLIVVMALGGLLWVRVLCSGHRVDLDVGQEYKFKEFALWYKDVVFGLLTPWPVVRTCMIDQDLCFIDERVQSSKFYSIPKLKSACCQVPSWCIYDPENATIPDCQTFTTEKDKMCYYCDVCIGGFLSQVTEIWRRMFPGYVVLLGLVIAIFTLGCQAFRQNKAEHYSKVCYTTKA